MPSDLIRPSVPVPMPSPPLQSHSLGAADGNAQSDTARQTAVAGYNVCKGNYDEAKAIHLDDVERYAADNDLWNQRKAVMSVQSPSDWQACWTCIQTMYQKGDNAYNQLYSAYEHLNIAFDDIDKGDLAVPVPTKIQWYNASTSQSNAAGSCNTVAGQDHTAFVSNANSFEAIIVNYG